MTGYHDTIEYGIQLNRRKKIFETFREYKKRPNREIILYLEQCEVENSYYTSDELRNSYVETLPLIEEIRNYLEIFKEADQITFSSFKGNATFKDPTLVKKCIRWLFRSDHARHFGQIVPP